MKTYSARVTQSTNGGGDILNLTDDLQALVSKSGIRIGQLCAMVVGSTAALSTTEYEPGLVHHDIASALEHIAPQSADYAHEATWHDDNGHSHVRATLVGPSLSLPVIDGQIPLGTWQQVILLEFDTRPRRREVAVTIIGE